MLIVGAGGLAAQLFEDLVFIHAQDTAFWSELDTKYLFINEQFPILKNDAEVISHFEKYSRSFLLTISSIENRKKLCNKFTALGGRPTSFISPNSIISKYIKVGEGSLVMSRVEIEAGVTIGKHCLVNKTANIGHGCTLGSYCELSPGVILTGEVELGDDVYVGARAIILPKVKIGNNVTIAAGSIVKKNVPDNAVVAGEFARVKFFRK
jgi:sugar O-acyltransferase (sialic acid O-acetyltransferase NeuD family)